MNLNINYDETRNIGNQLISKTSDFDQLISSINTINSQIVECWRGADADKYFATVNEQMQYMRQLSQTIYEIGNYLIKVSNAYQSVSQNNANSINL